MIELTVQCGAFLLYGGYNIFDEENVYLSLKPMFINLFAAFLAFNAMASGLLWLCYAAAPIQCNGLLFRLTIFAVDELADMMYTVFPLILVLNDDYNTTDDVLVLLGQLNVTSSGLVLLSAFTPLLFLCGKSLFLIIKIIKRGIDLPEIAFLSPVERPQVCPVA